MDSELAETIGWIAWNELKKEKRGLVRHVFPNTIYIDLGDSMLVITKKGQKAPVNINLNPDGKPFRGRVSPGQRIMKRRDILRVGSLVIELSSATIYNPGKLLCRELDSIWRLREEIERLIYMTGILYSSIESSIQTLPETNQLKEFIEDVVRPFSEGKREALRRYEAYYRLIGLGDGFTPAGDDFLSGFLGVFNTLCKVIGLSPLRLSRKKVFRLTSWASGMLLLFSQKGLLDDGMREFIEAFCRGEPEKMTDRFFEIIRRGHSSGLDITLGVLVAVSSIYDYLFRGDLFRHIERILFDRNPY